MPYYNLFDLASPLTWVISVHQDTWSRALQPKSLSSVTPKCMGKQYYFTLSGMCYSRVIKPFYTKFKLLFNTLLNI